MALMSILDILVLSVVCAHGDWVFLQEAARRAGPTLPDAPEQIDQSEQRSLGHGYSRHGDHICFKGVRIDLAGRTTLEGFQRSLGRRLVLANDVDAATFVALGEEYSKDKDKVYYKWISPGQFWVVVIPDADPATFEVMDSNLAKDATRVWRTDVPIAGADAATARVVNPGWVWRDKRSVYYQFTRIVGADPETFRHLNQAFYRDANHVYWSDSRLQGADVATFRTFGNDIPYAVDERHVWFADTRLPNIDAGSFRLLHNHVFADRSGVYVSGRGLPVIGADLTSFRKVAELASMDCVLFRDAGQEYLFDPSYVEVYTIRQARDAVVISKPVWFAERDGTFRHVATVSATLKDGALSEPAVVAQPGFQSKPMPTWEVEKMRRMTDAIREATALCGDQACGGGRRDATTAPATS